MRIVMVSFPAKTPESYHLGVNAHRRLLVRYKVPRGLDGAIQGAVTSYGPVYSFPSCSSCPILTLQCQESFIANAKATASLEVFWLDAEWFNGCFPNGVG